MEDIIVEIGMPLSKSFEEYNLMMISHGLKFIKSVYTHDQYWTNQDLSNMSEHEMKNACVRYRETKEVEKIDYMRFRDKSIVHYYIDNLNLFDPDCHSVRMCDIGAKKSTDLILPVANAQEWTKVFDTTKIDYQYKSENMLSMIQLQNIDGLGLVLYYDNPDYYQMPAQKQRIALIDELNRYGFNFQYTDQGVDKLRTFFYKKECFSYNQNA